MAVSAMALATISSLTASPSADGIDLNAAFVDPHQNGLPYLKTDTIEYWAASSNNRDAAAAVAYGFAAAKHTGLLAGETRYYWARARRGVAGQYVYGDFYPVSPTGGVEAKVFSDSDAFVAYTPTFGALSGTLTTVTNAQGRYKVMGKRCRVIAGAAITDIGTGSGGITISLPLPFLSTTIANGVLFNATTAVSGAAHCPLGGSTQAECYRYDGAFPVANGQTIIMDIEYELA